MWCVPAARSRALHVVRMHCELAVRADGCQLRPVWHFRTSTRWGMGL